ncbi:MAG TPA: chromate efflux transporter [Solirubrobacterales bacterium]|nr:chromate efflux transporter [Solirubrobacterales bacterium]
MADPPLAIFRRFLHFGLLAWGGPAAQIAMIKRECVDEEGWVDEETFRKTLAVYQVLPGPEAHELCVYFGRIRGGKLGALAAGLGFMLPGFVLMLGLSILYVEAGLSHELDELFYGLAAAVAALIARACVRLGSSFVTDLPLALIAIGAFALTHFTSASFVLVLAGAGLLYELRVNGARIVRIGAPAIAAVAVPVITVSLTAAIFFEGLKAGLLTFGGAYTVIPFLQESAVNGHGWLTDQQFVDGLAIGGVLPAPLIIFSTFVGYVAGGLPGGIAMTVGIFLPAFLFPIFLHRQLVAIADNPRVRPFLLGVAAGVIGLIAAVGVDIVETSVVDLPTAVLAIAAFAALTRWHAKTTVLWVVLACGAVGTLLQATVV